MARMKAQEMALKLIDFYRDHAWTKGTYARDKTGEQVSIHSEAAVEWCMLGALDKCGIESPCQAALRDSSCRNLYEALVAVLPGASGSRDIPDLNDFVLGSRDTVMEALRKVAKDSMGKGGGYILEPGITLQADIPRDNLIALVEEVRNVD